MVFPNLLATFTFVDTRLLPKLQYLGKNRGVFA